MLKVTFFALLFFVCIAPYAQIPTKLKINLDQTYGGTFSDFLDSVEYIPLETSKESLFGQITNLIVTDSSFVVTDNDTKSVLFFSKTGKFLRRISKNGVLTPFTASFNRQQNRIEIPFINYQGSKLVIDCYTLSGDIVDRGTTVKANDLDAINNIYNKVNSIIVSENCYWVRNKIPDFKSFQEFYYFSLYKNSVKVKSAIRSDSLNRYSLYRLTKECASFKLPILHSDCFYYSTPLEHKVYKVPLIDGDPELCFQFIFPAKFGIDGNLLTIADKKQLDNILSKKWYTEKTVLGVENILYAKDYVIFKTMTGHLGTYSTNGSITARNFLYQFENNKLVSFEKISPDVTTYFLPFCSPNIISNEGFSFDHDFLYTHISSLNMFASDAANRAKKPVYPVALEKFFKTQNSRSNPVIVRMKLRK